MLHSESEHDGALADGVMHDYTELDLSPRLRAILDYATALTRSPHDMQESDVQARREQGLTDEEILSVVLITCNFNFMTRLADGLGVQVDPHTKRYVDKFMRPAAEDDLDWLRRGKATPAGD